MVDSYFFTLYSKRAPYNACTSLVWILYFISIFLDRRLGLEPTLHQLKGWNLRAIQIETHMRASILNTGVKAVFWALQNETHMRAKLAFGPARTCKPLDTPTPWNAKVAKLLVPLWLLVILHEDLNHSQTSRFSGGEWIPTNGPHNHGCPQSFTLVILRTRYRSWHLLPHRIPNSRQAGRQAGSLWI
jgi:hypothetical protein